MTISTRTAQTIPSAPLIGFTCYGAIEIIVVLLLLLSQLYSVPFSMTENAYL